MIRGNIKEFNLNVFNEFNDSWALLTAGGKDNFNCMTISWGGLGILWNKNVGFVFVRPTRYTYEFMEKNPVFTLSFFDSKYKGALQICGSISGRENNKFQEANLTPIYDIDNNLYYAKEAKFVLKFKKIYYQDFQSDNFLDKEIEKLYPKKDYHRLYIGEITQLLLKEE